MLAQLLRSHKACTRIHVALYELRGTDHVVRGRDRVSDPESGDSRVGMGSLVTLRLMR